MAQCSFLLLPPFVARSSVSETDGVKGRGRVFLFHAFPCCFSWCGLEFSNSIWKHGNIQIIWTWNFLTRRDKSWSLGGSCNTCSQGFEKSVSQRIKVSPGCCRKWSNPHPVIDWYFLQKSFYILDRTYIIYLLWFFLPSIMVQWKMGCLQDVFPWKSMADFPLNKRVNG